MRCALYFGSFNPLHIGHITIAQYVLHQPDVDSFYFVLSPHNPSKKAEDLQDAQERLEALEIEVEQLNKELEEKSTKQFSICNIEFHLPKPLYTYNTLCHLQQQSPNTKFILIMGADNIAIIEKWYKWQELLNQFEIWVYPRKGVENTKELCKKYGAKYLDAPRIDISSTEIREGKG